MGQQRTDQHGIKLLLVGFNYADQHAIKLLLVGFNYADQHATNLLLLDFNYVIVIPMVYSLHVVLLA